MFNWRRAAFWALSPVLAAGMVWAQTSPNWQQGYKPSAAEWNQTFASKQDVLGVNGTTEIAHGGSSATTAVDARTNFQVPGLGDNNLFTGENTLVNNLLCWQIDCAAGGTGGILQFDGSSIFEFKYHVGGLQHKASIDADAVTLQTPLPIGSGGTGGSTALNALNAFGTYPLYIAAQFNKTNTTSAAVTGSTLGLAASGVYYFRAQLFLTGDATGGVKLRMGTPDTLTVTSISYRVSLQCTGTNTSLAQAVETDITTSVSYSAGCTGIVATLEGTIQANAAGTFGVFFAQASATGTSSVLVNSSIQYQKEK